MNGPIPDRNKIKSVQALGPSLVGQKIGIATQVTVQLLAKVPPYPFPSPHIPPAGQYDRLAHEPSGQWSSWDEAPAPPDMTPPIPIKRFTFPWHFGQLFT